MSQNNCKLDHDKNLKLCLILRYVHHKEIAYFAKQERKEKEDKSSNMAQIEGTCERHDLVITSDMKKAKLSSQN